VATAFGFVGVLVGAIASTVATVLGNRSARRAAKDEREHQREMAAEQRAQDRELASAIFQADSLVELQMTLSRLYDAFLEVMYEKSRNFHRTGNYGGKLPDTTNRRLSETEATALILAARISDDTVREPATEATRLMRDIYLSHSDDEATAFAARAKALIDGAQVRIGELLRSLPPPSSRTPLVVAPYFDPRPSEPDSDT
jgi:hypothetical protein